MFGASTAFGERCTVHRGCGRSVRRAAGSRPRCRSRGFGTSAAAHHHKPKSCLAARARVHSCKCALSGIRRQCDVVRDRQYDSTVLLRVGQGWVSANHSLRIFFCRHLNGRRDCALGRYCAGVQNSHRRSAEEHLIDSGPTTLSARKSLTLHPRH